MHNSAARVIVEQYIFDVNVDVRESQRVRFATAQCAHARLRLDEGALLGRK